MPFPAGEPDRTRNATRQLICIYGSRSTTPPRITSSYQIAAGTVSIRYERRSSDLATVAYYVEDFRNLHREESLAMRKMFLRSFVEELTVTGKDVPLTYTMPLPT